MNPTTPWCRSDHVFPHKYISPYIQDQVTASSPSQPYSPPLSRPELSSPAHESSSLTLSSSLSIRPSIVRAVLSSRQVWLRVFFGSPVQLDQHMLQLKNFKGIEGREGTNLFMLLFDLQTSTIPCTRRSNSCDRTSPYYASGLLGGHPSN